MKKQDLFFVYKVRDKKKKKKKDDSLKK